MANTVCVFGDSVAKGVILDHVKQKYLFLKDSCVNLIQKKFKIGIKNYASFGCTITKGEGIIEKHIEEISDYENIFLEFGGNDCDFAWDAVSEDPDGDHQPNTPPEEFEEKYLHIIREVKKKNRKPILVTLPPLDAARYFAWISRNLNPANILKWLGEVHVIYRWHELYNMIILRLAQIENLELLDLRSAFLRRRMYSDLLCEDGIHPNGKGHEFIGEIIMKTFPTLAAKYA